MKILYNITITVCLTASLMQAANRQLTKPSVIATGVTDSSAALTIGNIQQFPEKQDEYVLQAVVEAAAGVLKQEVFDALFFEGFDIREKLMYEFFLKILKNFNATQKLDQSFFKFFSANARSDVYSFVCNNLLSRLEKELKITNCIAYKKIHYKHEDRQIVAYGIFDNRIGWVYYLYSDKEFYGQSSIAVLFVHPYFRGKHIARNLLAQAVAEIKKRKLADSIQVIWPVKMFLKASPCGDKPLSLPRLVNFYKSCGWRFVIDQGSSAVMMFLLTKEDLSEEGKVDAAVADVTAAVASLAFGQ